MALQGAIQLDPNIWGFIPSFLSENDVRPASEQFDEWYVGGWCPFPGFKLLDKDKMEIQYGVADEFGMDPPMTPLDHFEFRDEIIYIYPHAWVLIMQKDGTWEICRMD